MEEVNEYEGFTIDCDSKAEWALKRIKEADDEHNRMLTLIDDELKRLEAKTAEVDQKYEHETSYLKHLLGQYMESVKCKETKTQKTYQLLTGKLVHKYGTTNFVKDEEALLNWARANRPALIKTKEAVSWADLKAELTVDGNDVITADGEVLECIKAEQKPDSFDIKWVG